MKLFWIALVLAALTGCQCIGTIQDGTFHETRDQRLYRAMQLERKAQELEYGNLANWNALQDVIDRNGIERAKLEGLWR